MGTWWRWWPGAGPTRTMAGRQGQATESQGFPGMGGLPTSEETQTGRGGTLKEEQLGQG